MMSSERRIPLILVNGRLSERSFNRWRYAPATIGALLRRFDLCLAQSPAYAARYRDLGAPRISTTGNLKLDVPEPPADAGQPARVAAAIGDRTTIAAASTHAGEETALIETHRRLRHSFPRLLTIIAPRHPDRGPGIVEIAQRRRPVGGAALAAANCRRPPTTSMSSTRWASLVSSIGSRRSCSSADRSPAMAGRIRSSRSSSAPPILHGPHVWNFAEIYSALDAAHGAEQVTDVGKLTVRVGGTGSPIPDERATVVAAARETVAQLAGALDRTLAALDPYFMQIRMERRDSHA